MSYDCQCGHAWSAHWVIDAPGEDECADACTLCGCGQFVGPLDSDSTDDREPIAEADAAEKFAQDCAKRRLEGEK